MRLGLVAGDRRLILHPHLRLEIHLLASSPRSLALDSTLAITFQNLRYVERFEDELVTNALDGLNGLSLSDQILVLILVLAQLSSPGLHVRFDLLTFVVGFLGDVGGPNPLDKRHRMGPC